MSSFLKISVRFLLDEFHGRGDGGESEWPPSPLRIFQALTNVAARSNNTGVISENFESALLLLEKMAPPVIIATKPSDIQPRFGAIFYVPNNDGDLWFDKVEKNGADKGAIRVNKNFRPTRLPENAAVHFLWKISETENDTFVREIKKLANAISAFGWGIGMVVAGAEIVSENDTDMLENEKWLPSDFGEFSNDTDLRIPIDGTLEDLCKHYSAYLKRISLDKNAIFKPVPPLSKFRVVSYRRENEMTLPPCAIFALRKIDNSGFAAFEPLRRRLHLCGMLRHCASAPDFANALGWNEKRRAEFVLGHDGENGTATKNAARLVFIPLPSIEWRGEEKGRVIGAIRRVLVTVNGTCENAEFRRIVNTLDGRELIDEKTKNSVAFLQKISVQSDGAIQNYFEKSAEWISVTPVILPGYDDPKKLRQKLNGTALSPEEKSDIIFKLETRIENLLRKAMRQAGIPDKLVDTAELQWRGGGFISGAEMAPAYSSPDHLRRYRKLHVRIVFREKISGPLCIGAGKFCGLGVFSAQE